MESSTASAQLNVPHGLENSLANEPAYKQSPDCRAAEQQVATETGLQHTINKFTMHVT